VPTAVVSAHRRRRFFDSIRSGVRFGAGVSAEQ